LRYGLKTTLSITRLKRAQPDNENVTNELSTDKLFIENTYSVVFVYHTLTIAALAKHVYVCTYRYVHVHVLVVFIVERTYVEPE
jgi:hypothetical protein